LHHVFLKIIVPLQHLSLNINIKNNQQNSIMRKLFIAFALLIAANSFAQDNTWEQTTVANEQFKNKYLAGAVPEVDGRVVFEKTISAPGKSKQQIYDILIDVFTKMTKEPNQFEQSRIAFADEENKSQISASYQEWLVFKNKPLVLDRTRLFYHLYATIKDGEANITMTKIYYLYDEERDRTTYKAEEWITDKYGLNKKKTKLARVSGKFRRKTIDRKDYIFNMLEEKLTK
jgi:colicin import membrane protein